MILVCTYMLTVNLICYLERGVGFSLCTALYHVCYYFIAASSTSFKGQGVDVWAAGVTLFCFAFGKVCMFPTVQLALMFRTLEHNIMGNVLDGGLHLVTFSMQSVDMLWAI